MNPSHIILIPDNEEVALSRVEFRLKQNVLALFPGTTCFYSSIVMSQPSRVSLGNKTSETFIIRFHVIVYLF